MEDENTSHCLQVLHKLRGMKFSGVRKTQMVSSAVESMVFCFDLGDFPRAVEILLAGEECGLGFKTLIGECSSRLNSYMHPNSSLDLIWAIQPTTKGIESILLLSVFCLYKELCETNHKPAYTTQDAFLDFFVPELGNTNPAGVSKTEIYEKEIRGMLQVLFQQYSQMNPSQVPWEKVSLIIVGVYKLLWIVHGNTRVWLSAKASLESLLEFLFQRQDEFSLRACGMILSVLEHSTRSKYDHEFSRQLLPVILQTIHQPFVVSFSSRTSLEHFKILSKIAIICLNEGSSLQSLIQGDSSYLQIRRPSYISQNTCVQDVVVKFIVPLLRAAAASHKYEETFHEIVFTCICSLGENDLHWASVWTSTVDFTLDKSSLDYEIAAAILRCFLRVIVIEQQSTDPLPLLRGICGGMHRISKIQVPVFPSQLTSSGDYTINYFSGRIIALLYFIALTHENTDRIFSRVAILMPRLIERFSHSDLMPWVETMSMGIGTSNNMTSSVCVDLFLKAMQHHDVVAAVVFRVLEVWHSLFAAGSLPSWISDITCIDRLPSGKDLLLLLTLKQNMEIAPPWFKPANASIQMKKVRDRIHSIQRTTLLHGSVTVLDNQLLDILLDALEYYGVLWTCYRFENIFAEIVRGVEVPRKDAGGSVGLPIRAVQGLISMFSKSVFSTIHLSRPQLCSAFYSYLGARIALSGGDLWEGGNAYASAAEAILATEIDAQPLAVSFLKQSALIFNQIPSRRDTQNVTLSLHQLGIGSPAGAVKMGDPSSFYFLVGIATPQTYRKSRMFQLPSLSVVRVIRSSVIAVAEDSLVERIQRLSLLRYLEGSLAWACETSYESSGISTLASQVVLLKHHFQGSNGFWIRRLWPVKVESSNSSPRCPSDFIMLPSEMDSGSPVPFNQILLSADHSLSLSPMISMASVESKLVGLSRFNHLLESSEFGQPVDVKGNVLLSHHKGDEEEFYSDSEDSCVPVPPPYPPPPDELSLLTTENLVGSPPECIANQIATDFRNQDDAIQTQFAASEDTFESDNGTSEIIELQQPVKRLYSHSGTELPPLPPKPSALLKIETEYEPKATNDHGVRSLEIATNVRPMIEKVGTNSISSVENRPKEANGVSDVETTKGVVEMNGGSFSVDDVDKIIGEPIPIISINDMNGGGIIVIDEPNVANGESDTNDESVAIDDSSTQNDEYIATDGVVEAKIGEFKVIVDTNTASAKADVNGESIVIDGISEKIGESILIDGISTANDESDTNGESIAIDGISEKIGESIPIDGISTANDESDTNGESIAVDDISEKIGESIGTDQMSVESIAIDDIRSESISINNINGESIAMDDVDEPGSIAIDGGSDMNDIPVALDGISKIISDSIEISDTNEMKGDEIENSPGMDSNHSIEISNPMFKLDDQQVFDILELNSPLVEFPELNEIRMSPSDYDFVVSSLQNDEATFLGSFVDDKSGLEEVTLRIIGPSKRRRSRRGSSLRSSSFASEEAQEIDNEEGCIVISSSKNTLIRRKKYSTLLL